jgi:hypothetical protein
MDKPEQVGSTHECFSDLLHALDANVLIAIACRVLGIPTDRRSTARYINPRIEIVGLSKAARTFAVDLVYTLQSGKRVVEMLDLRDRAGAAGGATRGVSSGVAGDPGTSRARSLRYGVLIMDVVAKPVVDQGIEQLRQSGELDEDLTELVSDTARKGYAFNLGREEGREEGSCSISGGGSSRAARSRPSSAGTQRPRLRRPISRSTSYSPDRDQPSARASTWATRSHLLATGRISSKGSQASTSRSRRTSSESTLPG